MIGIDGATFRIINTLINKGKLPTLARMIDKGTHGILMSTVPAVSAVAWTSFMTGKNSSKHQIFDFHGRSEGTYKFNINSAKDRKASPLWMHLSVNNKRVLVIGVTMTYPPDPVNGYMVSGLGAPVNSVEASFFYPPELAGEIANRQGRYRTVLVGDLRKLDRSDLEKEKYLDSMFSQIEYRVKLFKYMWQKEQFDFSMVFFLDTDGVSHYFWKYMDNTHRHYRPGRYSDAIFSVYEKIDGAIAEILDTVKDGTSIIMMSDHGFGPLNKVVFLNNWLALNGYLRFKDVSVLKGGSLRLTSLIRRRKRKKQIRWTKTKAYSSGTAGNVFINSRKRDSGGIVDASDYDSLCSEIKDKLLEIEDPETGEKVVDCVYRRKELFIENNIPIAPDLVVAFKRGYAAIGDEIGLHDIRDTGEIIADSFKWSGTHEPEGVFISYGKKLQEGI